MHREVVSVDNVSFCYFKSESVLSNVSFKSYSSQILAIVGPSGCGKTTLIKLILSLLKLDNGSIKIFERPKGDKNIDIPGPNVGYMPQEEALPTEMMVKECLYFYAFLNKMSGDIAERINRVLKDFELFDYRWNFIFTLSGGMKRRLSLAVALLHRPKLLILDEPSVGADPVLRHKIWQILSQTRNNEQSVILTTHYLDECRYADNILFMRKGRKLAEASARDIVTTLKVKSLDDAFLELCSSPKYTQEPLVLTSCPNILRGEMLLKENSSDLRNFFVILALCYRFLRSFLFSPVTLLFLLPLSGLNIQICNFIFQDKPDHLPIGLVVENQTIFRDNHLLARLNITPKCFDCIHPKYFANYVDSKAIDFVEYKNIGNAINDIKRAKIKAAIYFNEQFGDSFFRRLVSDQSTLDEFTIRNSKIVLEADTVSRMLYSWIEHILLDGFDKYTRGSRANLNLKPIPLYPMEVEDSLVGNITIKDYSAFDSFWFSLVINSVFPLSISLGGIMVLNELKEKLSQRFLSAGITPNLLWIAQTSVCVGLISFSGYFGLIYGLWMRGLETNGSRFLGFALIVLQSFVGVFLGQIIGLWSRSPISLFAFSLAYSYITFACQGLLVAIESQPYYLQQVSFLMPNSLPLESLKAIYLRELGIESREVFKGFITNFVYIVCFGLISQKSCSKVHL